MEKIGTAMKRITEKLEQHENVLIMTVGDSITWGCNHCSTEETLCAVLARLFAEAFPDVRVLRYDGIVKEENRPLDRYDGPVLVRPGEQATLTVVKSGVGGDTVKRAIARAGDFIGRFETGEKPDLFLLMFGINDAIDNPEKYATPQEFYDNYHSLYRLICDGNPTAEIVLLTPTFNDYGTSPASGLDPYSDMVKRLGDEVGCRVIDTHCLWMEHLIVGTEHSGQRDWLSENPDDHCHFSPLGSQVTAEYIFHHL